MGGNLKKKDQRSDIDGNTLKRNIVFGFGPSFLVSFTLTMRVILNRG